MAKRDDIITYLDEYLHIAEFRDYGPNGWQILGQEQVSAVAVGVSANLEFFEQAVAIGAQLLIVHHGLFWEGFRRLDRAMNNRLRWLYQHDLTLLAYHLPLDAHPVVGNNVQLARQLGLRVSEPDPERIAPGSVGILARRQDGGLVAVVSGSGGGEFPAALEHGIVEFVTGDAREPMYYLAKEYGIKLTTLGHYNSEQYGIKALGSLLEGQFGVSAQFLDVPNPL